MITILELSLTTKTVVKVSEQWFSRGRYRGGHRHRRRPLGLVMTGLLAPVTQKAINVLPNKGCLWCQVDSSKGKNGNFFSTKTSRPSARRLFFKVVASKLLMQEIPKLILLQKC